MKRLLALLIAILAIAPACRKKTTKKPTAAESVLVKKDAVTGKAKKEGIFLDEPVDKFSLQEEEKSHTPVTVKEEAANPFLPAAIKDKKEVSLFEVEEEADRAFEVKQNDEQRKHGLKTIYFDFDKFMIRKDQSVALERDLAIIKKLTNEGRTIVIEGHACRFAGSDAYNLILSEKRARSVANWLVKKGVKRKNIKTVGRGYELCIVPEGTRQEQAPNRRVEFYVLK